MVLAEQSYYIICHLLVRLFILTEENFSAQLLPAENPYNVYIRHIIPTTNISLDFLEGSLHDEHTFVCVSILVHCDRICCEYFVTGRKVLFLGVGVIFINCIVSV